MPNRKAASAGAGTSLTYKKERHMTIKHRVMVDYIQALSYEEMYYFAGAIALKTEGKNDPATVVRYSAAILDVAKESAREHLQALGIRSWPDLARG